MLRYLGEGKGVASQSQDVRPLSIAEARPPQGEVAHDVVADLGILSLFLQPVLVVDLAR